MPPQQPYLPPQQPAPPQQDYDFIMNPGKPKRQFGQNFFDGSPKSLIIMLGIGAAILIIIVIAYQAMKPASIVPELGALSQTQAKIVHLSSLASDSSGGATDQATKNLAANLGVVTASQQIQLVNLLAKNGDKLSKDDLVVASTDADKTLATATQNSDFDSTFTGIAKQSLESYQSQLSAIFAKTSDRSLKSQLQSDYHAAGLLLEQVKSSS